MAGPGGLDLTFDPAAGVNGTVYCVLPQPDGKVIIGGAFSTVRGAARRDIARLKMDGSVDTTFTPNLGAVNSIPHLPTDSVRAVILQSDGKLLIGGSFTNVAGFIRNGVARLNTDGSLDNSFNAGIGGNGAVHSIAVQSDGKVLIGGAFTNVNGSSIKCIVRLNSDGSVDNTFNMGTGIAGAPPLSSPNVASMVVQPDGRILVAGGFTSIDGTNHNNIARLNPDGSLDETFDSITTAGGLGLSSFINAVVLQQDGKILLAGSFISINGTNRDCVARLNRDGSLDLSFDPGSVIQSDGIILNPAVQSIALQSDGKILIGGDFDTSGGTNHDYIARLNTDGSLDDTFNAGASGIVYDLALQTNGEVLVGGTFTNVNGVERNDLAQLNPDGSLDETFDPGDPTVIPSNVASIALQPDGKVLLGIGKSDVDYFNGWTCSNTVIRLNENGSLDSSLQIGVGLDQQVNAVVAQSDGRILIGGDFTKVNGTNRNHIARLNADGGLDTMFDPGSGADNSVLAMVLQPDGKAILGGGFTVINGTNRNCIARLNSDGSLDGSFDPGTGAIGLVYSIALQTNGEVIIGGSFTNINGVTRNRVARLRSDGTVDGTFDAGNGPNSNVYSVAVQADGKVLLGGSFDKVNGTNRQYLARLNTDGTLDNAFNPGSWAVNGYFSSEVYSVALQWDGKLLTGGDFFITNGITANHIARFNTDGSLDRTFVPGALDGYVYSIALQPDGRVLIGGTFGSVDGWPRNHVARLWGDGATLVYGPETENDDFVVRFMGIPGIIYTVEYEESLSPANWQKLINLTAPTNDTGLGLGVFEVRDPVQHTESRFYRVVYPSY